MNSDPDPKDLLHTKSEVGMDFHSWSRRFDLICLGFFFYTFIFLLSHTISAICFQTYLKLPPKEKVFWDLAATRAVFGIQSIVAGLRTLMEDSSLMANKVQGQEEWSWFNVLTATGFFLFENLALHTSNVVFRSFDMPLAVHHGYALTGYVNVLVWNSQGHFLPMMALLLEMSTPFTCISWMLLKAGWAQTLIWRANQWVMIHMFHCRMVLTYYIWWVSLSHWGELSAHVALPPRLVFFSGMIILTFVLNPIWTHKKTMQLLHPVDWNFDNKPAPDNGPVGHRSKVHPN